jgi:DNA polymerase V
MTSNENASAVGQLIVHRYLPRPLILGIPAGFPSPAEDYMDKKLDLNDYCIRNRAATFFAFVEGDSMHDAGFFDGDLMIIDRSIDAKADDIIVAVINGDFTVKRLGYDGQQCPILIPENKRYSPIRIDESMDFRVWGVVKGVVHLV